MKLDEVARALAATMLVRPDRAVPVCGFETICDPCLLPDCFEAPSVAILYAVAERFYFKTIPGSDDKVLLKPHWSRDSLKTERWVTGAATDSSATVCNPRDHCLVTTPKAAKAVYDEYKALGEPAPNNATFVLSLMGSLLTDTGMTVDQLIEMARDPDSVASFKQSLDIMTPRSAKHDEL